MREYFRESKTPFHVYNRGTEKRIIFTDYAEYCRFLFLMWACRIGRPESSNRKDIIKAAEAILGGVEPDPDLYVKEGDGPLVNFVAWNLEPNHFHFLLVSTVEGGIAKYMSKLSNAYTKYFNVRHNRNGRLFQSSYQSIEVKEPQYLYNLVRYINLNHLELVEPLWKEGEIKNKTMAREFTDSYYWSAHPDFLGIRNSLLVDKKTASDILEGKFTEKGFDGYRPIIDQFLPSISSLGRYVIE